MSLYGGCGVGEDGMGSYPVSRSASRSMMNSPSRTASRATSRSRAPSMSRYDLDMAQATVATATKSPFADANYPRSSRPPSRAPTPVKSLADEMPRPRSRSRTPAVPSYTDALCTVSKRLRQRSIPPPAPPPKYKPVQPALYGKPPPAPRVVASDYYKKYIKSIYEREPMFQDFYHNIPPAERNFYNRESLAKIKQDFHEMISDKWTRKGFEDPSVEHDLGSKVLPWKNVVVRDSEPASERLFRLHSRPMEAGPPILPRLYVYHRSTWQHYPPPPPQPQL